MGFFVVRGLYGEFLSYVPGKRTLSCVEIFLAFFAYIKFRNRNGVKVSAPEQTQMTSESIFFRQRDEKWADEPLGNSKYTMGSSGCLTTCLTIVFKLQGITVDDVKIDTPSDMNHFFNENNVYDEEGNIVWDSFSTATGCQVTRQSASEMDSVDDLLKRGIYPIILVHMPTTGKSHFIVVAGYENGEYQCVDPLEQSDNYVSLSKYENRIYAVRYVNRKNESREG